MTVLFLTDSIGEGIAGQLAAARAAMGLSGPLAVLPPGSKGRSASGTTPAALKGWRGKVSDLESVWLQLGTNDVVGRAEEKGLDALEALLDEAGTYGVPVYVATIPKLRDKSVAQWNNAVRVLAGQPGRKIVDLEPVAVDFGGTEGDGVHLTETSYRKLAARWLERSAAVPVAVRKPFVWRVASSPWRIEVQLTTDAWVWVAPTAAETEKFRAVWTKWRALLTDVARSSGVPLAWLLAFCTWESGGDPKAKGSSGEVGLFQLMPFTWGGRSEAQMMDPRTNALAAAAILATYRESMGENLPAVASCYNAGPSATKSASGKLQPKSFPATVAWPWGLEEHGRTLADGSKVSAGYISQVVATANYAPFRCEGWPADMKPKGAPVGPGIKKAGAGGAVLAVLAMAMAWAVWR